MAQDTKLFAFAVTLPIVESSSVLNGYPKLRSFSFKVYLKV
jgi:hypothetical protein